MSTERFDRIEAKLDDIRDVQGKINETLAVNTNQLAEHMKRTKQLEIRMVVVERMVWMAAGGIAILGVLKTIGLF